MTTAAIYARLSVSAEESVSIARQLEAGRQYAAARGWTVVGEFVDDGVSASTNRPEDRKGWSALLASPEPFTKVIAWKVDRVARKVIDFLRADETLREQGAGIVAVEQSIDMTTADGRMFATVLAAFAENEAAATSARVNAARAYMRISQPERVIGRSAPYGYRLAVHPSGVGKVLVQDPETLPYLEAAARMVLDGTTIYGACKWLDSVSAPLPRTSQGSRTNTTWSHTSLERMLRNPTLAGMVPSNPGRLKSDNLRHSRDVQVLRHENGLPVVCPDLAILTADERRSLVSALDTKASPAARPRASRNATSPLLSRLVECGDCEGQIMARGSLRGRPVLKCPGCHQTISRNQLDPHVVGRLLAERGSGLVTELRDETPDNSPALAEIEEAISIVTAQMGQDGADVAALVERLTGLKELRSKARSEPVAAPVYRYTDQTVSEAWEAAEDDVARRAVLAGQAEKITIQRGRVGRLLDPNRVQITWRRQGTRIKGGVDENMTVSRFTWAQEQPA